MTHGPKNILKNDKFIKKEKGNMIEAEATNILFMGLSEIFLAGFGILIIMGSIVKILKGNF